MVFEPTQFEKYDRANWIISPGIGVKIKKHLSCHLGDNFRDFVPTAPGLPNNLFWSAWQAESLQKARNHGVSESRAKRQWFAIEPRKKKQQPNLLSIESWLFNSGIIVYEIITTQLATITHYNPTKKTLDNPTFFFIAHLYILWRRHSKFGWVFFTS